MKPCERLSDRIPDVALGRARWTAEEAAHLERCADCRAEWTLAATAGRVGKQAPRLGDLDGLSDLVVRRLAGERRRQGRYRRLGVRLGMAAALAALGWAGLRELTPGTPAEAPAAEVGIALPELEVLDTAELDSLLQAMDATPAGWSALVEPTLGELDAEELEQVLGTWEG